MLVYIIVGIGKVERWRRRHLLPGDELFVAIQQGLRSYLKAGPLGLLAGLSGT
jgi:hypothetical protein